MAIRISKYYLRLAILALLAGFSSISQAVTYYNDPYGSGWWTTGDAACVTSHAAYPPPAGVTYTGFVAPNRCTYSNGGYHFINLATSCPAGQTVTAGETRCATPCSISGQVHDSGGACVCPSGQSVVNGACVADPPCSAADQATAQAAITPTWSYTTVVPLNNGFNTVNESVNDYDRCESTCKVRVHATIKVGGIAGASYTVVESGTEALAGGACENMTPSNAKVTGVNIGYGGEGTGCAAGFVYGSVNGVMGCHYVGTAPGGAGSTPVPGAGQASGGSGTSSSGTSTTTTTTTNSDGTTSTSTSTTSSSGTATNPVFGNGTDGSGIGCDPTDANYFKCQGLGDFKGDETDYADAFDLDAMDTKIEDKKNEIVEAINNFKDQIGDELGISATGALPVYTTTVNGTTLRMDFSQYASQLSIFASVLVFVSLVISAYLILRGS